MIIEITLENISKTSDIITVLSQTLMLKMKKNIFLTFYDYFPTGH